MDDCRLCVNPKKLPLHDVFNAIAHEDGNRHNVAVPDDNNQLKNLLEMENRLTDVLDLNADFVELFNDGALSDFVDGMSREEKRRFTKNVDLYTVVEFFELLKNKGPPNVNQLFHQAVKNVRLQLLEKLINKERIDLRKLKCFKSLLNEHKGLLEPMMASCERLIMNLEQVNVISSNTRRRLQKETNPTLKLMDLLETMPLRVENWYERFLLCLCYEASNDYLSRVHPKIASKWDDYEEQTQCIRCIIHSECEELYSIQPNTKSFSSSTSRLDSSSSGQPSSSSFIANREMTIDGPVLPSGILDIHPHQFFENLPERDQGDGMSVSRFQYSSISARSESTSIHTGEPEYAESQISDMTIYDNETDDELRLHQYQIDLCSSAILGQNVLICSPTGSGKTYMAMEITKRHLEAGSQGDGLKRVIYMVQQSLLVEQQYKTFTKYFDSDELYKMHGKEKNKFSPVYLPSKYRIVFSTSELILNAMKEDLERFWKSCSLLIFDEAHNCHKKTTYNKIMSFYLQSKYSSPPVAKLPQIVGLTASPGTGKANSEQGAREHLFNLVADLDCYHTAYLSNEDYYEATSKPAPKEEMCATPPRSKMWLSEKLQELMIMCENELIRLHKEEKIRNTEEVKILLNFSYHNRSQAPYMNILGQLHLLEEYVNGRDKETLEILRITRHYLKKLHRALVIYHLTRDIDACNYLRLRIKIFSQNSFGMVIYSMIHKIINEAPSMEEDNPCLRALKTRISEHLLKEKGDSRVLVFVKERRLCAILEDAFKEDPHFPKLHEVGAIVGACKNTEISDTTTNLQQARVLKDFHNGVIKILFSTAIAEEGLDVAQCKLVIRYVHVTNEIAMLQSKGRARKENAEYMLIYPKDEEWLRLKEIQNQVRNKFMDEAMKNFNRLAEAVRQQEIKTLQLLRLEDERRSPMDQDQLSPSIPSDKTYEFLCKNCNSKAFDGSSLRNTNPHFVCIGEEVRNRYRTESNQGRSAITLVLCNHDGCEQTWGEMKKVNGRMMFQPTFTSFRIRCKETMEIVSASLKKWNDVRKLFDVQDLKPRLF